MSLVLGMLLLAFAIAAVAGGSNAALFYDPRALALVLCGTVASLFFTVPFATLRRELPVVLSSFKPVRKLAELESEILELAKVARKNGILALEGREGKASNSILKKGIILISNSADHDTVQGILEKEAKCMSGYEKSAKENVERAAAFSPGIGMVGTLIEIVQMLYRYSGPKSLAPEIAKALLPVVYGAAVAYVILLPLAARIGAGSQRLKLRRELSIEGVLAIQAGEPLHIVEERLRAFESGRGVKAGNQK